MLTAALFTTKLKCLPIHEWMKKAQYWDIDLQLKKKNKGKPAFTIITSWQHIAQGIKLEKDTILLICEILKN